MGRRNQHRHRSHTLPSSPTYSSSSSEFEFTISVSPRKSSAALCPADELFYKGQLLPLHLSPRLSMVRTLLLSSASTSSSSDTTTTASRDSTASHSSSDSSTADLLLNHHHPLDCDSSRPSSVAAAAAAADFKLLTALRSKGPSRYFSLAKFSSVFRKDNKTSAPPPPPTTSSGAVKRVSSTAREVIRKYFKKVKPFYEKLSPKHRPPPPRSANATISLSKNDDNYEFGNGIHHRRREHSNVSQSFSGNLWYPRRRSCISSCPSSMRSSPSHSKSGLGPSSSSSSTGRVGYSSDTSSMEELQSAIQGAIAHCKNSLLKTTTTNEGN